MNANKPQTIEYYDDFYDRGRYSERYTRSIHYPWWQKLRIPITSKILDIGCGSGQFAEYLKDKGVKAYTGVDFSNIAITKAKKRVPEYNFHTYDCSSEDWLRFIHKSNPDLYVCLEVLEHIDKDRELLASLKPKPIIFSVPNFLCKGHVRRFKNVEAVRSRYAHLFKRMDFSKFIRKANTWFIVHGELKNNEKY